MVIAMKLNAPGQPSTPSCAGAPLPIEAPSTSSPKPAPSTPALELHLVLPPNDSNRTDPSINADDGNLNGQKPTLLARSEMVGIRYLPAGSDRNLRNTHRSRSIFPAEGKPSIFCVSTPSRV